MILTIGNSGVYEMESFQAVAKWLDKRGQETVLFCQDKCLDKDFLSFSADINGYQFTISIDGRKYPLKDFTGVWYLKPHLPIELLEYKPVEHRQFIDRQFLAMRQAIWNLARQRKWLNDPWAIQAAENKIFQLAVAAETGFVIPDTIITSNPDEVRSFYLDHDGKIVVKLLAASPILNHVVYTNAVTEAHMQNIESARMSPSIFQSITPKAFELRITVVGEKIFPARINSQADNGTKLDWRRKPKLNDFEVAMEETSIPKPVEVLIKNYMKQLGLTFGCIDMIVTPFGEYVFLEINPNGQWWFVQLRTGMAIAEAIAEELINL